MKKKLFILFTFLATLLVNISYVSAETYDNYQTGKEITCGSDMTISASLANIFYYIILIIEVAVPITLVIFGMVDLIKALTAGKEDDNKKNTNTFFKRIVTGMLVFAVVFVVKFVISLVSDNASVTNCINCFVNGANACRK